MFTAGIVWRPCAHWRLSPRADAAVCSPTKELELIKETSPATGRARKQDQSPLRLASCSNTARGEGGGADWNSIDEVGFKVPEIHGNSNISCI